MHIRYDVAAATNWVRALPSKSIQVNVGEIVKTLVSQNHVLPCPIWRQNSMQGLCMSMVMQRPDAQRHTFNSLIGGKRRHPVNILCYCRNNIDIFYFTTLCTSTHYKQTACKNLLLIKSVLSFNRSMCSIDRAS